jgi:chromosome segregation ATPase
MTMTITIMKTQSAKETQDQERERAHRIAALTQELEALRRSLPAHSIKPTMLMRIEDIEEEIEMLQTGHEDTEPILSERD